jgi:predicted nicotinamide N-methyase
MEGGVKHMEKIKSNIAKISVAAISVVMAVFVVAISAAPVVEANFSNNARNLAGLIAVDNTVNDGFGGSNDLADLIVLGGLFPTSSNANQNARDLAGLIAVDNITDGGGGSFGGSDDLADLIVLYNLFLDP